MSTPLVCFLIFCSLRKVHGFCGTNIRWSHRFDMENVYGMWYGVKYLQHTPDMTNVPKEIGCVTLYITDATNEANDDWLDWSTYPKINTDQSWQSYKSNPWSNTALSGSWIDIQEKRLVKRDLLYQERRLRVLWDEDGQTMEQSYVYSPEAMGLWTVEQWRPMEKMLSRGIDVWYPDDTLRHLEVIRVLQSTPDILTINHCSEAGTGGIFTLELRRSPATVTHWEWQGFKQKLYNLDLPNVYRHAAMCDSCVQLGSIIYLVVCLVLLRLW